MMTVLELINKLQALPGHWLVIPTKKSGLIEYQEPADGDPVGKRYGYLYPDGRPNLEFVRKNVPRR